MASNKLIKTFFDLVSIDSPSGEEAKAREFVSSRLSRLGFSVQTDKQGNLIAKNHGSTPPVLVGAHFDTVEPGRGIIPTVHNGWIKSKGNTILGADNKAALAAILVALEDMQNGATRSLEIVITVREETDGGVNHLPFSKIKSKYGVIADSVMPIGNIIYSAPWIEDFLIHIKGAAAHSSRPEKARNALLVGATAMANHKWGYLNEDTIANIGLIKGGDATNTVPAWVEMKGEIRSFSKKKFEEAKKKLEAHFKKFSNAGKTKLKFQHNFYGNGYSVGKDTQIMSEVLSVYKTIGLKPKLCRSFGASDANAYANHGIDILNIGDGVENAHTVDEKISTRSLEYLYRFFKGYFMLN